MLHERYTATATARANIALAKYWGKADIPHNLPAVPSISLTLDGLVTETEVSFDPTRDRDELVLDGRAASPAQQRRVTALLDRVRKRAGLDWGALVTSANQFPTAAGLASSASGFAALAAAACAAAKLDLGDHEVSALARAASASAARSVFGGFVELPAGKIGDARLCAEPLMPKTHWDLRMVIALTETGPKAVGSTEAMERSRLTSPYYESWVESAPSWSERIKTAIAERDIEALGTAMEQSTLAFHCCAITSSPAILYWGPGTIAALRTVQELRQQGVAVWSTMDAGPHVKALCEPAEVPRAEAALRETPGVLRVLTSKPGDGVSVSA